MSQEQYLEVAIPRPLDRLFTYRLPSDLSERVKVGGWVKVPFGRGTTHGYVVNQPIDSIPGDLDQSKIKNIIEASGDSGLIPADVLKMCRWVHEYYQAPLGEVIQCAAPAAALGLRSRKQEPREFVPYEAEPQKLKLNSDQEQAVQILSDLGKGDASLKCGLLEGVTGSGKTEVYLELARRALDEGKSVLILVPEIALTPQLHQRFEKGLGTSVGLWHSAVADGKRRDQWAALTSGKLRVVVGARSAVFAPLQNLGLIVVDEEHDGTYKQEDRVRYNARDLAILRGKMLGALTVLGSATPSLESLEKVREGHFSHALLKNRATGASMPEIELVTLTDEEMIEGLQAPLAKRTVEAIQETLLQGQQVMVFLNRRGFSAFLVCDDCGEVEGCPNCSISLTFHKKWFKLRCHVCGYETKAPERCSFCDEEHLRPVGAGTESLEEELPTVIPEMKPLRLDRDQVTSAKRLSEVLESFRQGEANVLLGTQMLVKGHDFPGVTLVVVVLADSLFRWPDFKAPERAYQVLTQVSGRAGRGELAGKVLVQTYCPKHPVLKVLTGETSREDFLESEREIRQLVHYPPFTRLARIRFERQDQAEARMQAEWAARQFQQWKLDDVEVLGPSEAFLEKAKGLFRWDLLIKAQAPSRLSQAVRSIRQACESQHWPVLVDVDPSGIG